MPKGKISIEIIARGDQAQDICPEMVVEIDEYKIDSISVCSSSWRKYNLQHSVDKGWHEIKIFFINDYAGPEGDRNLYIKKIILKRVIEKCKKRRL
ncbi:MAG: carbohydrate-binding domain-containing protein [Candidatus Aminicenantaceae bacterium]